MGETETLSPAIPADVEEMAATVLREACDIDVRLATAESCTGGLLASLLTDVDGVAHAFERGFVTYSEAAKNELLGVPRSLIERDGAVSKPVAVAMAEGALHASDAAVALAITGFAGKGGPDDEAGLVHLACAGTGQPTAHREEHFGDIGRGPVRIAALRVALEMIATALDARIAPAAKHG
ncbi:MAG: CinA family protein [Sphingomonas sp.]|uniref:CinA family protein n=1 Tax=Sphingomonas sp. TaxID=28214 RepID=UPI0012033DA4|nr:CinA family protein [Sphingomonas sp.]THD37666.1 MAG: CinA family protein [Sphingomonas sp.]